MDNPLPASCVLIIDETDSCLAEYRIFGKLLVQSDGYLTLYRVITLHSSSDCHDQEKQNPIANEIDCFLKKSRIHCNHYPYIWWSVN